MTQYEAPPLSLAVTQVPWSQSCYYWL